MFKMSEYTFIAGLFALSLALLAYVVAFVAARVGVGRMQLATAGGPSIGASGRSGLASMLASYGTMVVWLAFIFVSASLLFRTVHLGRGPFANMYEFSVAFAWGTLAAYLFFERRYHLRTLGLIALPIALGLQLYALYLSMTQGAMDEPLVPALQNNLLLSVHVAVAIIAYGTFSVAFGAALLYLIQTTRATAFSGLPKPEILDEISYRAVIVGYPFLTLTLVLGAVWAEQAWGRYWAWDPKETASLVTWLVYGAYLHARVVRGFTGRKSAWILMAAFALTLFTYFGNYFFGGLHSYAGLSQ